MSERGTEYLYPLLRRAARELERLELEGLSRTRARLRPAHVPVLAALLDASPLTPSELTARCETEPSTLTGLLTHLEAEGLITREKVVLDQRSQTIHLTARGRAAARVAVRTRAWAQNATLAALGRESADELVTVLGQLAAHAQAIRESGERPSARPRPRRVRQR